MTTSTKMGWGAACAAALVFAATGCGGEEDVPQASAATGQVQLSNSPDSPEPGSTPDAKAPAQTAKEATPLTDEEAAMLAEFRANRQASPAASAPAQNAPPRPTAPAATPTPEASAAQVKPVPAKPAEAVPYDFENTPAPANPLASAQPASPANPLADSTPKPAPANPLGGTTTSTTTATTNPLAGGPANPLANPDTPSNPLADGPRNPLVDSPNNPLADGPGSENPGSPTIFAQHQITDSGYGNMVAMTMLYPEDWKVEGGITRINHAYYNMPFLNDIKFTAPDGRQAHFFPAFSFEFGTSGMGMSQQQNPKLFSPTPSGNMYHPLPQTPGQWIMQMAKDNPAPNVTNLRLVSEEPEPEMTKLLQQQSAQVYQMIQQNKGLAMQTGVDSEFDTQATVVKLRYTENGVEVEESILVAWSYFINLWNGQATGGTWGVPLMVSMRGPVGSNYLIDPELMAIFHSVRPNPQWLQKQNEYWNQLARIRSKGAADRNRDWQKHNAKMQQIRSETNAIIVGGHAERTAMRDAGHAKQMDAVNEVTPYNINGETVKIPDYYDNVHTDGTGRYILSNDFNYNPNRDLNRTGNWTKVQPQQ